MGQENRRIVLGVTADMSIGLMRGFPGYLVDKGWDVHVVSSPGPLLDELDGTPGITTHRISMARKPAPLADLKALVQWVRLLMRLRPHVTSIGTPKAGLLGGLAALVTRVPSRVYLVRGLPLETATGPAFIALMMLEKLAFAAAHTAIAVSFSLKGRVVDLGLAGPEKVTVLGAGSSNGVDLHRFSRARSDSADRAALAAQLGLDPTLPVIGFVGRLTADKGLTLLAEARALLTQQGIAHQLLVVGGIEDGLKARDLLSLRCAGRAPIETGQVRDTAPYYHMMDILCLPTRREGFPNVVLEAAASNVATVTTDATGAVDSVIDGETGLIVEKHSPEALAGALATLILDEGKRETMGIMARRRAEEHFSQPHVWSLFEEYYYAQSSRTR